MPRDGMRIEEPGRGPWYLKKKRGRMEWEEVSCYATGWHENRGTRSRTVVLKKRKNGGERKSPVMSQGGIRIEEPGRGPWY